MSFNLKYKKMPKAESHDRKRNFLKTKMFLLAHNTISSYAINNITKALMKKES